jgi:alpha,alpha-trehalose phosphorylase
VTDPDEYSAVADNNVYTNVMAQQNLRAAADAVERHPHAAARLGGG